MAKPILLVEDETIVRESLKDWLTDEGYQVATAEDGESALEVVGKQEFGVVVLDLKLPGKDGIQVLREARVKKPNLKAIIITAYPSPDSAAEAIKAGALDYIIKPFTPDTLQRMMEQAMDAPPIAPNGLEMKKIEVGKREEIIASHMQQGQLLLQKGNHGEAVQKFQQVLEVAPGNLEARQWLLKARRREPGAVVVIGGEAEIEGKPKPCVWMKMGVVKYRMCTRNFDCVSCEFDQQMQSAGESPEIAQALEKLKELPGTLRTCRYALRGEVSYRLCSRVFGCVTCEFSQNMEDATEHKLAKLAVRREVLKKKATKA